MQRGNTGGRIAETQSGRKQTNSQAMTAVIGRKGEGHDSSPRQQQYLQDGRDLVDKPVNRQRDSGRCELGFNSITALGVK